MAGQNNYMVVAFDSTHAAMASQKILESLHPFVIPTPREITADCGMSLRIALDDAETAMNLMNQHSDLANLCHWHVL